MYVPAPRTSHDDSLRTPLTLWAWFGWRRQGAYLRHIQLHTNSRVNLRGTGSGHIDPGEAPDRLHLQIVYGGLSVLA